MEPLGSQTVQAFWLAAARSLARRRNFGYWWDHFSPWLIGLSLTAAVALMVLRLFDRSAAPVWFGLLAGLVLAGAITLARCWRQRMTLPEGLAGLDEMARLHNRLVSAHAGVGEWPPVSAPVRDTATWNWPRLAIPLLGSALLLLAAAQTPRIEFTTPPETFAEPLAWSQVDSWLKTLEEGELADPQTLAAMEEQLNELRQKPSEEWYEHNGLEAGDALRQHLEQGLREMRSALEQGSQAMTALQQLEQTASLSETKAVSQSLQQALQGLKAGNLSGHPALQERLQKASSGNPKKLTPEQVADLQQRMKDGMKTVDRCVAPQVCEGQPGTKPGSGGKGGGGESQPVALNDQATRLQSQRVEGSANENTDHSLPGDLVAVTSGSHDINRNAPLQSQSGGKAIANGEGGNAVWRDSLTPAERQVLERYFK